MENEKYEDIINLPHPTSPTHPRMPRQNRAAQFAPFAALTGHETAIEETARLTDTQLELDEDRKEELDEILYRLQAGQPVMITYFAPDERKSGGAYVTCSGCIKKTDEYEHTIIMMDGTVIPAESVIKIDIASGTEAGGEEIL